MVKQGFLNLSKAEQDRIVEAAIDEFSEKDYETASLNNIITRAGISKGSMYHYFNNKEDLYIYIIKHAMEIKTKFLKSALGKLRTGHKEMSFFENLEFQMLASIDFAFQHYRLHQFGLRLQNMTEGPLRDRVFGDLGRAFELHIARTVEHAVKAGEIRSDFSEDFVVRILKFTLMHFTDIYPDFKEFSDADREVLKEETRKFSLFLKKGLQKNNEEEEVQ